MNNNDLPFIKLLLAITIRHCPTHRYIHQHKRTIWSTIFRLGTSTQAGYNFRLR